MIEPATDAEQREYSYYLGVFVFLGFALAGLTIYYWVSYPEFPYRVMVAVVVLIEFALAVSHLQDRDILEFGEAPSRPISLRRKKAMLLAVFVLYVLATAGLMVWGGGRESLGADLLVLSSALSAFVAKKGRTKVVVGLIAILAYFLSLIYFYDGDAALMEFDFKADVLADLIVITVVITVSAATGDAISRRLRASIRQQVLEEQAEARGSQR